MNDNRGFNVGQENFTEKKAYMIQDKVPNSGLILTLGIISIVNVCCCFGMIGPLVSIIALILVPKAKRIYNENHDLYTESSYNNIKTGQICAIIGLVLSIFAIIYFRSVFAIFDVMSDYDAINGVWNQLTY